MTLSIARKALEETIEFRDLLKERIELLDVRITEKDKRIKSNIQRLKHTIGMESHIDNITHDDRFTLNEWKLDRLRTKAELETYEKIVAKRQEYFAQFEQQFKVDLKEADANFDHLYNKARTMALKSPNINAFLESVKVDIVEIKANDETKVEFYKRLKSFIKNG